MARFTVGETGLKGRPGNARGIPTITGAAANGTTDDSAAFNAALANGSVFLPRKAGTGPTAPTVYYINSVVQVPLNADLIGAGSANVTIKLGPAGQIAHGTRTGSTTFEGGRTGGFRVDGGSQTAVAGGGFYIGYCLSRTFFDIQVVKCTIDCTVIETAQNCTFNECRWQQAGRSALVLDYGTGGHVFNRCEIGLGCLYGLEFRQTGLSPAGVYPTAFGPSGNTFYGCIIEYGGAATLAGTIAGGAVVSPGMIYHGAGGVNHFVDTAVSMNTATATASLVIAEQAANAVSTTAALTNGNPVIVVASATNIVALMSVKGANIIPGTTVTNVAGTSITLSNAPLATVGSQAVGFGAVSSNISFTGPLFAGTTGQTIGLDLRGGVRLGLHGDVVLENCTVGYKMTGNDAVLVSGWAQYFALAALTQQQAGDTLTFHPTRQILTQAITDINHGVGDGTSGLGTTFGTSWANLGAGLGYFLLFYLGVDNQVHIEGAITNSANTAAPVFTLPAEYRPASSLTVFYVGTTLAGNMTKCQVALNGDVTIPAAAAATGTYYFSNSYRIV